MLPILTDSPKILHIPILKTVSQNKWRHSVENQKQIQGKISRRRAARF